MKILRMRNISMMLLVAVSSVISIKLELVQSFGTTGIYKVENSLVKCGKSGLGVLAFGSPKAFHPYGSPPGLLRLSKGGTQGNWFGIATLDGRPSGIPVVQGVSDPAPGFYVSKTTLIDNAYSIRSPLRYANADTIPYISIPKGSSTLKWKLGDLSTVCYQQKCAHAIVAQIGPKTLFGQGSMQLARKIGINEDPNDGGVDAGVKYIVYPGSNSKIVGGIPSDADIQKIGQELFQLNNGNSILQALDLVN